MIQLKKLHPRGWNVRLAWDWFMVWVAIINLSLILFDFTYLTLRPFYLGYMPVVTRVYDPVLGITPHPLTEQLRSETAELRRVLARDSSPDDVADHVARIRVLTYRAIQENPFDRSEQSQKLEVLKDVIAGDGARALWSSASRDPWSEAVDAFWPNDPSRLEPQLRVYESQLEPLLGTNYFRVVGPNGKLKDLFWLIDLPFLVFFWLEFGTRWILAVRSRFYPRWYFFPIFNWYDLIGLVPYTQFRVFRLLRAVSIYMRLHRNELTQVGQDAISRGVARISSIIVEEISDAVAVRILTEVQVEIREGTAKKIFNEILTGKRAEIESMAVAQIRDIVSSDETQGRIRSMVRLNLEAAVESSTALRSVPLPRSLVQLILRTTGQAVVETTLQALNSTLKSEKGEQATKELVGGMLDQVIEGPLRAELDALSREISLDVIEQVKEAVAEKKWTRVE